MVDEQTKAAFTNGVITLVITAVVSFFVANVVIGGLYLRWGFQNRWLIEKEMSPWLISEKMSPMPFDWPFIAAEERFRQLSFEQRKLVAGEYFDENMRNRAESLQYDVDALREWFTRESATQDNMYTWFVEGIAEGKPYMWFSTDAPHWKILGFFTEDFVLQYAAMFAGGITFLLFFSWMSKKKS